MTKVEEQRVIASVLGGYPNAFEELVEANEKNVYNLALKMVGNEADALDISQEAFLKAYTGLRDFRGDSKFSVWLYKLTYNICIDFLRKKNRRPVSSLSYLDEEGELTEAEIEDLRYLPEDEALRAEARRESFEAINSLGYEHRQILTMRECTGMSYAEIAEALYISEGTVKSRIARARKILAKKLLHEGTFSAPNRQKIGKEDVSHE